MIRKEEWILAFLLSTTGTLEEFWAENHSNLGSATEALCGLRSHLSPPIKKTQFLCLYDKCVGGKQLFSNSFEPEKLGL